ncbi:MAG: DUF3298 and DUF4163 domain-containing protein [Bacteroides sp.]|nr:DUF3298 and DUF4163 domain-containing protein [Bacteroides sp.]
MKKKQYASLLTLLVTVGSFLFSCGNKMSTQEGALQFDSITYTQTTYLFDDPDRPGCNIDIVFTYVKNASRSSLADSLNHLFMTTTFDKQYVKEDIQATVEEVASQYIYHYKKDMEPVYEADLKNKAEEIGSWYSFYESMNTRVIFYEQNLLSYMIYMSQYSGGAHGMYGTTFLNIDLSTGKQIYLEDLFREDYEDSLTDLLWKQLLAQTKSATRNEVEEQGYTSTGELEPTGNFCIGKKGITFYYNVYEITPYYMGPTEIEISYEALKPILKSNHPLKHIL